MIVTSENLDEFIISKAWWEKRCPKPDMDDFEVNLIQEEILKFPKCRMLQIGTYYGWTAWNVLSQLNQVNGFLDTVDQDRRGKTPSWVNHVNRIINTHKLDWIMKHHTKTSNVFFKKQSQKFHVIFIDGDHSAEQVRLDLVNSSHSLHPGGTIICHDARQSDSPRSQVLKAFLNFTIEGYTKEVLDTTHGLGILRPVVNGVGSQRLDKK